jgi:hypothetical protein
VLGALPEPERALIFGGTAEILYPALVPAKS